MCYVVIRFDTNAPPVRDNPRTVGYVARAVGAFSRREDAKAEADRLNAEAYKGCLYYVSAAEATGITPRRD
jgi:hypothetical protein